MTKSCTKGEGEGGALQRWSRKSAGFMESALLQSEIEARDILTLEPVTSKTKRWCASSTRISENGHRQPANSSVAGRVPA